MVRPRGYEVLALGQAARFAGVGKTTLTRAIKAGPVFIVWVLQRQAA
jgi:hypothetical protein